MGSTGKGLPRHTSSRGNQMLNRCSRRNELDDLVLIDVDSDDHNVIIVDVEESVQKKLRKPSPCTVINIDDDDEDEVGASSNGNDSSSASTSRSCVNPVQSTENGSRQGYGFGSESKSGSTESDCSDCECVEVPPEEIRSQWEQASKRRKTNQNTRVSGNNQASTSAYVGKENATTQPCGSGNNQASTSAYVGKENATTQPCGSGNNQDSTSAYVGKENATTQPCGSGNNQASTSAYFGKENATTQPCVSNHHSPTNMRKSNGKKHEKSTEAECHCGDSLNNDGNHDPFDDFSWTFSAHVPNLSDAMRTGSSLRGIKSNISGGKPHVVDSGLDEHPAQGPSSAGISSSRYAEKPPNIDADPLSSVFREAENVLFADTWIDYLAKVHEEPCLNEDQAIPETELSDDSDCEACDSVTPMDVDEELPNTEFCSSHDYRTINLNTELNSADGKENLQNHQKSETDIRACNSAQTGPDGSNCVVNGLISDKGEGVSEDVGEKQSPDDILTDRQKIKETDVYKRAMEEEAEARQRQLRIQAEEAQRLRRRKKAESMRITDMERRQKQRLEEMRETQKKDEENLHLKEKLRADCRKKLNLVEHSCKDMASLLRKLGVDVGSNLFPSITEVQAAYKKAMLKFHPDRASRTDMRQQVEAEEKFKLISRMKEKYLPVQ